MFFEINGLKQLRVLWAYSIYVLKLEKVDKSEHFERFVHFFEKTKRLTKVDGISMI